MKSASIAAAAAFAFALLAIACTTTTTTSEPTTTEKDAGTTKDAGKDAAKETTDDDDDDDSTAKTCGDEADFQTCGQCCANETPAGYEVYDTAISECLCKADVCATECEATACAATPKNPDATCTTCVNSKLKTSCQTDVQAACQASNDCVKFATCLNTCPGE